MLNKPGTSLEWCNTNPTDGTTGQPAIIDPSAGKKDTGYLALEEPSRQDMNWFQNLSGLWNGYLETLTDGAAIVNAAHYDLDVGNTGVQNITALSLALVAGKKVFIPAGTYDVSGNPTLPDGAHIFSIPGSVIFKGLAASGWDVKNKTVTFEGIRFEDDVFDIQILCGHSNDNGFTLFEKCTFDGANILNMVPGVVADSSGLVQIENCIFIGGNAVNNPTGGTTCPRIIATGNDFGTSNLNLRSSSGAVRIFRGNRFNGGNIELEGGNVIIENSFFDNTPTDLFLYGTFSGIFANNYGPNIPLGVSINPSRFTYENNRDQNGVLDNATDAIDGALYYGESGADTFSTSTTTTINFDVNRTVSVSRTASYTKDVVENGAGQFTYLGIGKGRTRISCFLMFSNDLLLADMNIYLLKNAAVTQQLTRSPHVGGAYTVFQIETTLSLDIGDTFEISIAMASASTASLTSGLNGVLSRIEVEGF